MLRIPAPTLIVATIVVFVSVVSLVRGQDQDLANRKALAYFANAADYQNAGAFELAAEEWEKLVKEFPRDAQASTAWHHLGICNLQRKEPNFPRATEAFREALKDSKFERREESLINLGWVLFSQASKRSAGSGEQKRELTEARSRLAELLKDYSDGAYLDQATFYLGETENLLGNRARAIEYFKQFLDNKKLARSVLRAEALYALAVAFDEEQQATEAQKHYQEFLDGNRDHRLTNEVRLRFAESLIQREEWSEADDVLAPASTEKDAPLAELILFRRGVVATQRMQPEQAARYYRELVANFPESKNVPSAIFALGQLDLQAGKIDQAIAHFRDVLQRDSSVGADAAHSLAVALMKQGRNKDAVESLEDSVQRFNNSDWLPTLRMDLADALNALPERADDARQAYENVANDWPDSLHAPRAAYNAAFSALEIGQNQSAQQWAERFLSRYPSDPLRSEIAAIAAESLLRQGQHAGAAQAFGKLIETESENDNIPQWKLRQAMALYLDRKYESAARNVVELIHHLNDPTQKAEAQFIAGASYLYQEQLASAIRELEASYHSDKNWPNADEALLLLGEAYQRNGDSGAARKTYEKLLNEHPQSRLKTQAQYKLAQLAAAEGDLTNAVTQYRAIVADPNASSFHNFALYGTAWSLMQQGKYEQAYEELRPLLEKNLQDSIGSEALLAQGVCLRHIGMPEPAVDAFQKFLARKPTGISLANGLYELGLALTDLRRLGEAADVFQKIVREVPDYPALDKVLYELGWNLIDQDKVSDATEKFALLAKTHPSSAFAAESKYMVAQHQYDNGQYQEAIEGYRAIVAGSEDAELLEKSLYKLGWSHFQLQQFELASAAFDEQSTKFPNGPLALDGMFMRAECDFKLDRFEAALDGFQKARTALEQSAESDAVSAQVRTLIYLHGGQSLRELNRWEECEKWLRVVIEKYPGSPYLQAALFELGNCKQNQGKTDEALTHFTEVADNYRNEVAARARFMLGEIHFARKDFVKAIPEFQRVMYGFGGEKAPEEIKKWQAKSAFEAARCSEALIQSLNGSARKKVVETTIEFYEYVVEKRDSSAELASQAQARLGELQKLR